MAMRMVYMPFSLVCERKKRPPAFRQCIKSLFKASSLSSSSRSFGWARKHTTLKGVGASRAKISHETWPVPVCDTRHDQMIHIGKNGLHGTRLLWRLSGQRTVKGAWNSLRQDGEAVSLLAVACHPFYHLMSKVQKAFCVHITRWLSGRFDRGEWERCSSHWTRLLPCFA